MMTRQLQNNSQPVSTDYRLRSSPTGGEFHARRSTAAAASEARYDRQVRSRRSIRARRRSRPFGVPAAMHSGAAEVKPARAAQLIHGGSAEVTSVRVSNYSRGRGRD